MTSFAPVEFVSALRTNVGAADSHASCVDSTAVVENCFGLADLGVLGDLDKAVKGLC